MESRPASASVPQAVPNELRQELDVDALALSKIPADPLWERVPLGPIFKPIDTLNHNLAQSTKLKLGATYTFLNQYATSTPDALRHNQLSGRLDFSAAYSVYNSERSAGSISMLVRSGTNIGTSQKYNLSDGLGSGLYLNCLQGGGPQEPISLNILYWRQDFLDRRVSFYIGKIHPNQYITLSMFNNDERTQFLNGQNDGDLAFAADGAYAGGAALEIQATAHIYLHAVAIDTEGSQQSGIGTLANKKLMESSELGWFSGAPGQRYRDYRVGFWHDDTKTEGSGAGGGIAFEHELVNGWAPFGRFALATNTGTQIKQADSLGLAQVHPFGRRGDMFGAAFNYTVPTAKGTRHESVFETFYRLRATQNMEIGPDLEISIHPANATKAYTTALLGLRMRVIF
jgi:porin